MGDLFRKLGSLRPPGRRLLLQAVLLVPPVTVALRLFGFARVYAGLSRQAGNWRPPDNEANHVKRARYVMRYVQNKGPYRGNCLSRSLILWWLLRRRGIHSDLRIGVSTEDGDFRAHAWVEYHGEPLNAREEHYRTYAAFDQAIVPEGTRFS